MKQCATSATSSRKLIFSPREIQGNPSQPRGGKTRRTAAAAAAARGRAASRPGDPHHTSSRFEIKCLSNRYSTPQHLESCNAPPAQPDEPAQPKPPTNPPRPSPRPPRVPKAAPPRPRSYHDLAERPIMVETGAPRQQPARNANARQPARPLSRWR